LLLQTNRKSKNRTENKLTNQQESTKVCAKKKIFSFLFLNKYQRKKKKKEKKGKRKKEKERARMKDEG